mmetsp:Transcript_70829/g.124688  ORF Transcript_70829/g.124688 Transcript_70829/m.124688 type:complete len:272 (+) Transcript_70829:781-1596(+)
MGKGLGRVAVVKGHVAPVVVVLDVLAAQVGLHCQQLLRDGPSEVRPLHQKGGDELHRLWGLELVEGVGDGLALGLHLNIDVVEALRLVEGRLDQLRHTSLLVLGLGEVEHAEGGPEAARGEGCGVEDDLNGLLDPLLGGEDVGLFSHRLDGARLLQLKGHRRLPGLAGRRLLLPPLVLLFRDLATLAGNDQGPQHPPGPCQCPFAFVRQRLGAARHRFGGLRGCSLGRGCRFRRRLFLHWGCTARWGFRRGGTLRLRREGVPGPTQIIPNR